MSRAKLVARIPPEVRTELSDFFCSSAEEEDDAVARTLRTSSSEEESTSRPGDWEDWGDDDDDGVESTEVGWGSAVLASAASGDVLAMGLEDKVALLERAGDGKAYRLAGRVFLDDDVTAVLCLPMAVSKRSETRAQDWVAVLVGLASGKVIFYSDRGEELMRQELSARPVLSLDFSPGLHGAQELSVLCEDVLVTIDGLSLYAALRASRAQAIRAARGSAEQPSQALSLKKWTLDDRGELCGHACLGPVRSSAFEQMETASMIGGIRSSMSSSLPTRSGFWVVGRSPFAGFYPIEESANHGGISDAVRNLADKVTSSASSYLGYFLGGSETSDAKRKGETPAEIRPVRVKPRNLLIDAGRQGQRLFPAPGGRLLALADAQARLFLIHTGSRTVVRVWKGYREAEVAWVRVRDDASAAHALFIAIFAPRRGLLEIWSAQNGPRVAAYNVPKQSRIICTGHYSGNLGEGQGSGTSPSPQHSAVHLLFPDGSVHSYTVPFHAALQDDSSAQIHDALLLKEIHAGLDSDVAAVTADLGKLKTVAALRSAAADVLAAADGRLALKDTAELLQKVKGLVLGVDGKEGSSVESRIAAAHIEAQIQLLHAFASLRQLSQTQPRPREIEGSMDTQLKCSPEELAQLSEIVAEAARVLKPSPGAQNMSLSAFLGVFQHSHVGSEHSDWALAIPALEPDVAAILGKFLLAPLLSERQSLAAFRQTILQPLRLPEPVCLPLFLAYWLSERKSYSVNPLVILEALQAFAPSTAELETTSEGALRASHLLPESFVLAFLLRSAMVSAKEKKEDDDDGLEALEVGEEKWDLLVSHLRLLCRLELRAASLGTVLDSLSLDAVLAKGRGFYREEAARLLASVGTPPGEALDALGSLVEELPRSLAPELLWAEAAWEAGSRWSRSPSDVSSLRLCLAYVGCVDGPRLRHGICVMLWETFLRTPFRNLYFLLEKVGKFPKDRLCRKEVGVAEDDLVDFTLCIVQLMEVLLSGNAGWEGSVGESEDLTAEESVDQLFQLPSFAGSAGAARESLVKLALAQPCTNFYLVMHHLHTALLSSILLQLKLSPIRPGSFFDKKGLEALFAPLHSHPLLPMADVEASLKGLRTSVLSSAVRGASLRPSLDSALEGRIWRLVEEWELDADHVHRQEVLGLYESGRDALAEGKLGLVESKAKLGADLLLFLGRRVARLLLAKKNEPRSASAVSSISPKMVSWLESLGDDETSQDPTDIPRLVQLQAHVVSLLSSSHAETSMANEIADILRLFS